MRIVYKGNYIRMACGEIGLVQIKQFTFDLFGSRAFLWIFIALQSVHLPGA